MQPLCHTESGVWQLQQPQPCFLFASKFSLFATGQWTPTITVGIGIQSQYFSAACMWYKPQLAMLLTCTPCTTAWNMCSKTAMLLGQQPTWGRHKAWIRCRNHSLAINNIEMSTTQQPPLPSSQSCSLQAWPLLQMSNITSTVTVYKVVRIRQIRLDMPNQEEEGERERGFLEDDDISSTPLSHSHLFCSNPQRPNDAAKALAVLTEK